MKIEIEFDSSYEATIILEGRKMRYGYENGMWKFLEGIQPHEHDTTIGGMIAGKLALTLIDILQAWLPEEESPDGDCWEAWEPLSDSVADQIYDKIG